MDRERTLVTALIVMQFVLGWGFLVHISPRFPGSGWGGVLGTAAALFMLVPLFYTIVKRVQPLKQKVVARTPMPTLLAWHVYAGILGSILAILHTGHRFDSWLGIGLIGTMLLSVLSGYIGRHFLRYVAQDLKERKDSLAALQGAYANVTTIVALNSNNVASTSTASGQVSSLFDAGALSHSANVVDHLNVTDLAQAIAETEYSVRANELLKRRSQAWLGVHIWTSIAFYLLLMLHIAASIQYGIRWLS